MESISWDVYGEKWREEVVGMKDIYRKNKQVLCWIYQMREYINKQDNVNVIGLIQVLARGISEILTDVIEKKRFFSKCGLEIDQEYMLSVLQQMLDAQEQEDYILYGDILQLQMLPVLIEVQNAIRNSGEELLEVYWEQNMQALKDKDMCLYKQLLECEKLHDNSPYGKDVYSVEDTIIGDLTVAVTAGEKKIYLHSKENPVGYVKELIDTYYNPYIDEYLIYGMGLGYHCDYLASKDCDLNVTILENDIGIIQLAMTYTDMSWYFNHSGVKILYDADWTKLGEKLKYTQNQVVLFHQPSVKRIKNEKILQQIQRYLVYEGSSRVRSDRMIRNYLFNIRCCEWNLRELEQEFREKTVIIVGAGPSLDKNVHLLKKKHDNTVVLAVGAVCRKLFKMGISMDYIIITDPKEVSDAQIQGLEESGIPMILLSTATKGVARKYQGKKYLLFQKGFQDAEHFADEQGLILFETGGSVATTAVDMCVRFEVGRIVFIGLDMAYTGNRNHASGARDEGITDYEDMIMVEDVYGNLVPTTRPFQLYREWIERRIARADVKMPVIDATEGGARIKGTEVRTLEEVLDA